MKPRRIKAGLHFGRGEKKFGRGKSKHMLVYPDFTRCPHMLSISISPHTWDVLTPAETVLIATEL